MEPKVFKFSFTVVVEEVRHKKKKENKAVKSVVETNATPNKRTPKQTLKDTAIVTNVINSETIEVELNGDKVDVRLLLVKRPELVHPGMEEKECSKKEAGFFAKNTLIGKTVQLEYDGPKWDEYGRLLAYVWIGNKTLNQRLLEEGIVYITGAYDPPYKYYDKYLLAQTRAKNARKGIWSLRDMSDIK